MSNETSPNSRRRYLGQSQQAAWLCDEGPFRTYVDSLSKLNPGWTRPDPANVNRPLAKGEARVHLLTSAVDGHPSFEWVSFNRSAELRSFLMRSGHDRACRRIYIMEGLATDYVTAIGDHFMMNPSFFIRQERSHAQFADTSLVPEKNPLPLPSLMSSQMFQLQYCELREFSKALPREPVFCARTGRHVGLLSSQEKPTKAVAFVERKVSFWYRLSEGGGWDVVILCDPAVERLESTSNRLFSGKNRAFQGGYTSFIPLSHQDKSELKGTPDLFFDSMAEHLLRYFIGCSDTINSDKEQEPFQVSNLVKKIVAAHLLEFVEYMKSSLPMPSLKKRGDIEIEDHILLFSKRCAQFRDQWEDNMLYLGYALDNTSLVRDESEHWTECQRDYQYIYFRLKVLKERADALMQVVTSFASIADSRESLAEAKRMKHLTLIAQLFIPLAYTSSLFSMQDDFMPGQGKFWVYWACAVPVIGLTALTTYFIDIRWTFVAATLNRRFRQLLDRLWEQRASGP